jgi:hypothetical protein
VQKSNRWENGAAISSSRNKTRTEISATRIVSSRPGRESTPRTPGSKPTSWRARPGRRKIRTRRRKRRTPQQQPARKLESLGGQVLRPTSTERTRLRIKHRGQNLSRIARLIAHSRSGRQEQSRNNRPQIQIKLESKEGNNTHE